MLSFLKRRRILPLCAAIACFGGAFVYSGEKDEKAAAKNVMEEKWESLAPVDGRIVKAEYIDVDPKRDDRLYFRYGPIRDSGVELERVIKGKIVWRSHVQPLGVVHSRYSHQVSVRVVNGVVFIDSLGASGIFETHDLETGKLIRRSKTPLKDGL